MSNVKEMLKLVRNFIKELSQTEPYVPKILEEEGVYLRGTVRYVTHDITDMEILIVCFGVLSVTPVTAALKVLFERAYEGEIKFYGPGQFREADALSWQIIAGVPLPLPD